MTIGYWLATFRAQFQREPKHSRAFRRRPQALVATQIERLEAVTLLSGIPPVDDLFPTTIANQAITIDVLTNDYVLPAGSGSMAANVVSSSSSGTSGYSLSFTDGTSYGIYQQQDYWVGTLGADYSWSMAVMPLISVQNNSLTATLTWGGEADGTHNQFALFKHGVMIAVATNVVYQTITDKAQWSPTFKLEAGSIDAELIPVGNTGLEAMIPPHSHLHIGFGLVDGLHDAGDPPPVFQGTGGLSATAADRQGFTIASWQTNADTHGTVDWNIDHTMLVFTPEPDFAWSDAPGSAKPNFTYQISYGGQVISRSATVTVDIVRTGTAPTLTTPTDKVINEDSSLPAVRIDVTDAQDATSAIQFTAESTNLDLFDSSGLTVSVASGYLLVTGTPKANAYGETEIVVTARDTGGWTTRTNFTVTVNPVNDPPQISEVPEQTTFEDSITLGIRITDDQTPFNNLQLDVVVNDEGVPIDPAYYELNIIGDGYVELTVLRPTAFVGQFSVTLTATDSLGAIAAESFFLNFAGDPVDPPVHDRRVWLELAIADAGLLGALGVDGTRFDADSLSYDQKREIMVKIYAFYAAKYNADPSHMLWAGLATSAGKKVVIDAYDRVNRENVWLANDYLQVVNAYGGETPAYLAVRLALRAGVRETMMNILAEMAVGLFLDIGWQLQAYSEEGLAEMEKLATLGQLPTIPDTPDVQGIVAWRKIDSGNAVDIAEGTRLLTCREQLQSLKQGYDQINALLANQFGWIGQAMSDEAIADVPGTITFRQFSPTGSLLDTTVSDSNPRWGWIRTILQVWSGMTNTARTTAVQSALDSLNSTTLKALGKTELEPAGL